VSKAIYLKYHYIKILRFR